MHGPKKIYCSIYAIRLADSTLILLQKFFFSYQN